MTETLCCLGYTEREAAFLVKAALLSGYFVRSQFNAFVGRECGALGQRFIERSVRLGHVVPVLGFGRRILYHAGTRPLYAYLGDADNRNRREHRPETIRRRLMILDYVIARPAERWLLTAAARREPLGHANSDGSGVGGYDGNPGKLHRTDGQPVSIVSGNVPRFAFIDGAARQLSEWECFLKARRPVLSRLGRAEVIYASCDAARFRPALAVFRRMVAGETAGGEIDRERLQAYFQARQLFEAGRYGSFDQVRLDRLREDRHVYDGQMFEQLYRRWQQLGDEALTVLQRSAFGFDTQLLPHAYTWLSPLRFEERKGRHGIDYRPIEESPRSDNR